MSPEEANKIIEQAATDLITLSNILRAEGIRYIAIQKMVSIAHSLDKIDTTELSQGD